MNTIQNTFQPSQSTKAHRFTLQRAANTWGVVSALAVLFAAASPSSAHAANVKTVCVVASDSTLLALYSSGQTFSDFLATAKARRAGWLGKADSAWVDDALLTRAKAVGGTWHIMAVAIDSCGDSMNSVPYLAKLAEMVPGLSLKIVLPVNARHVQDAHLSLDGRRATPTFVLLDENGRDAGCIVELPQEIRDWAHGVRSSVSSDSLHAGIRSFYVRSRGQGIIAEAVAMLEAAKTGSKHCLSGAAKP